MIFLRLATFEIINNKIEIKNIALTQLDQKYCQTIKYLYRSHMIKYFSDCSGIAQKLIIINPTGTDYSLQTQIF